jgi:hypothetical protein
MKKEKNLFTLDKEIVDLIIKVIFELVQTEIKNIKTEKISSKKKNNLEKLFNPNKVILKLLLEESKSFH